MVRKKHPTWRRKEIKEHFGVEFFRLYHYDQQLLESLLPDKTWPIPPGKDWEKEDIRLAQKISRMTELEKQTINKIDNLSQCHGLLRKHLVKLPRTRQLLVCLGVCLPSSIDPR